jgi:transposase
MKMAQAHQVYALEPVLYMAFELGDKTWLLGFSNGHKERKKSVTALDTQAVLDEIQLAKKKSGLPEDCKVISCYEAGWEGFWLARWLASAGIINYVLDSAAIETNRRKKKVKTDKVDTSKLLNLLWRYCAGEKKAFQQVRVPSQQAEAERQLHRERKTLVENRGSHVVRINSLLRSQGIRWEKQGNFLDELEQMRLWTGEPLPEDLKQRLKREWARYEFVDRQIEELEKLQKQRIAEDESCKGIAQLMRLKSVGPQSAWILEKEIFGWRDIKNRRELGALVGLTPTPYCSGQSEHEQGISKAGNRRVRTLMIELAWGWIRYQPHSKLSMWYMERFASGSKRQRRVGIVALARKLIIQLWQYRTTGVLPAGAALKA